MWFSGGDNERKTMTSQLIDRSSHARKQLDISNCAGDPRMSAHGKLRGLGRVMYGSVPSCLHFSRSPLADWTALSISPILLGYVGLKVICLKFFVVHVACCFPRTAKV